MGTGEVPASAQRGRWSAAQRVGGRQMLTALALVLVLSQLLGLLWPSLPFAAGRRAEAIAPGAGAFERTWARTDRPIAQGAVARTWMWGPEALTAVLAETYAESPGGQRLVQYFDKSRMEITQPEGDATSPWYVTNGLLVMELVTGQLQVGDTQFEQRTPAEVNVAGDPDDALGPTYATFATLRAAPALADGALVTQRLARDGSVSDDPTLAVHGVTAAFRVAVPGINHQVASVFWTFMHQQGLIWDATSDTLLTAALFESPFYATGLPIAEAYWTTVRVGGTPRDVLVQCFERRCLTWTPGNPAEWQVEAGNVGQHYLAWRAATAPQPTATTTPTSTLAAATATGTGGSGTAVATLTPTSGTTPATITATATDTPRATRTPTRTIGTQPTHTPTPTATSTSAPATATRVPTQVPLPNMPDARGLDSEEREFLTLLNEYRADEGLSQLVVSEALNCAAYGYSYDMGNRDYFGWGPDRTETMPPFPAWLSGPDLEDRVEFRGYTNGNGLEQIIGGGGTYQYGAVTFEVFEDSPSHDSVMRRAGVTHIGIGRAYDPSSLYKWYWTIVVGNRSGGAASCR